MRLLLCVMPFVVTVMLCGTASAGSDLFHKGGRGECDGCHGANGSENGFSSLRGIDASSTCLRCHAGTKPTDYRVATHPAPPAGTPPQSLAPGGDFAYLRKNYLWINSNGTRGTSPGERHGHNIVAPAYGYVMDNTLSVSPGGSYPAAALSCISCHDPHGNFRLVDINGTFATEGNPILCSGSYGAVPTEKEAVGSYRLLAGKGYQTRAAGNVFIADPPIAVAPKEYNRSEASSDTRVAYGKGVSKWCANCHEGFLLGEGMSHTHPADTELGATAAVYNCYVKSGDLTGSRATAYSSLTPFQKGELTDPQQLSAELSTMDGPNPGDRITCLTCHRAHASGWDSITRWNTKGTFLTVAGEYPGIDAIGKESYRENSTGKLMAEYRMAMYNRNPMKFATFQRQLCDKCHAKD
jgi:hypothetical protein